MLAIQHYQRLLEFQSELLTIYMNEPYDELCTQRILQLLDKKLGYRKSLMGFIGNESEKVFSPTVTTHGIDMQLVQDFLSEIWSPYSPYNNADDLWLLSRTADYKKQPLYRQVLKPRGLADSLIVF